MKVDSGSLGATTTTSSFGIGSMPLLPPTTVTEENDGKDQNGTASTSNGSATTDPAATLPPPSSMPSKKKHDQDAGSPVCLENLPDAIPTNCSKCKKTFTATDKFLNCPCQTTQYCNPTCQRDHWLEHCKLHRRLCKEMNVQNEEKGKFDQSKLQLKIIRGVQVSN